MSQDAIAIAVSVVVVVGAAAILWGIGYQLGKPRGNGRIGGVLSILFRPLGWIMRRVKVIRYVLIGAVAVVAAAQTSQPATIAEKIAAKLNGRPIQKVDDLTTLAEGDCGIWNCGQLRVRGFDPAGVIVQHVWYAPVYDYTYPSGMRYVREFQERLGLIYLACGVDAIGVPHGQPLSVEGKAFMVDGLFVDITGQRFRKLAFADDAQSKKLLAAGSPLTRVGKIAEPACLDVAHAASYRERNRGERDWPVLDAKARGRLGCVGVINDDADVSVKSVAADGYHVVIIEGGRSTEAFFRMPAVNGLTEGAKVDVRGKVWVACRQSGHPRRMSTLELLTNDQVRQIEAVPRKSQKP